LIEVERIARIKKQAMQDLAAIEKEIKAGECPDGENHPEGERWFDTQSIYGGGSWFIIDPEWIWYVQNNGMDGDNWSRNNVRTGGAGAIGWRVLRSDQLVADLTHIKKTLAGKIEQNASDREMIAMMEDMKAGRGVDQ
jgi:hypothetical protein